MEGILAAQETAFYAFPAKEGQQLTVRLAKEGGVLLTILGPNQEPIDNSAKEVSFYQGKAPVTGRYTIQVNPVPGLDQSDYNLTVALENSVQPTPTPLPLDPSSTPAPLPTEIIPTPTPTEITPTPIPDPIPTENPLIPSPTPTEIIPSPPE
ncbi:PPC domain-containing protein [Scytonema sp. UIC 10036]|uniref:PPC domain-containing protein n=1 Tax=Scytonema sp. UIC 10036 TaxID=2304196 RepID=UPI00325ACD91